MKHVSTWLQIVRSSSYCESRIQTLQSVCMPSSQRGLVLRKTPQWNYALTVTPYSSCNHLGTTLALPCKHFMAVLANFMATYQV